MELEEKKEVTVEPEVEDLKGKKLTAALSYLFWLTVIPMIYSSESKFIKYHANQGLVLAIAETVFLIITAIVSKILWGYDRATSLLVETTMLLCFVGVFGMLALIGIFHVLLGKERPVPTFGKIKLWK